MDRLSFLEQQTHQVSNKNTGSQGGRSAHDVNYSEIKKGYADHFDAHPANSHNQWIATFFKCLLKEA
jgi:hypothetical protein